MKFNSFLIILSVIFASKMSSAFDQELERLYSPSVFNVRMSPEAVIREHVRFVTEESHRIRSGSIPSRLGVPYGDSLHEKADIFGTDLPPDAPIFVYISGGYWQMMSGEISAYPVEPMYNSSIVTVIVDYARAPGVTLTEIVGQVLKATKWILDFATKERKSSSITFAGHSAGAHLCGMILCSPWFRQLSPKETSLFKGVFHLSGVYDLKPILRTSIPEPLGLTLVEAIENSPSSEENVENVAENLIEKNPTFHTFIIVAEHDSPAFQSQGQHFAKALSSQGLKNVTFETIPKTDHFDLVEKLATKSYVVTSMIRKFICGE